SLAPLLLASFALSACARMLGSEEGPCSACPRPARPSCAPTPRAPGPPARPLAAGPIAGADTGLPIPPPMGEAPAASGRRPGADADAPLLPREGWDVPSPRAGKVIVVHHSASREGGDARFDGRHRAKGWDGVGHGFRVGTGTDQPDGPI